MYLSLRTLPLTLRLPSVALEACEGPAPTYAASAALQQSSNDGGAIPSALSIHGMGHAKIFGASEVAEARTARWAFRSRGAGETRAVGWT